MELQKRQNHVLEASLGESCSGLSDWSWGSCQPGPDRLAQALDSPCSCPISHPFPPAFLIPHLTPTRLASLGAHCPLSRPCQRVSALPWCFLHLECSQMAHSLPLLRSLLKGHLCKEPYPSGTHLKCHLPPTSALPSPFPCSISCITHYIILLIDF